MKLTSLQIRKFQKEILDWWKTHKRDLPWRHTRDPYRITVSEIMLQQTQVLRVIAKYAEFIEAWPTVQALAQASPASVLRLWKGMGYNRRALYLHAMAGFVVKEYGGKFPKDEKLLTKLPGVGIYTARAILVFAFGKNTACVDTNISQIITHFFFNDKPQKPGAIQETADQLVPVGKSWEWHQALMDYGSAHTFNIQKSTVTKKIILFKESDRFIRGKIIDYLRVKPYRHTTLIQIVSDTLAKPSAVVKNNIENLKHEGLLEIHNNIVSLPR